MERKYEWIRVVGERPSVCVFLVNGRANGIVWSACFLPLCLPTGTIH